MKHSSLWLAAATGLFVLPCCSWLLLAAPAGEEARSSPFTFLRFVEAAPEEAGLETAHAVYQGPGGAEVHLVAGFPYGATRSTTSACERSF